jgi:hypothetical protein
MLCSSRSKACRGFDEQEPLRDGGTKVSYSSTTIDGPGEYSIPTQADFLFVYSTIPGILLKKKGRLFCLVSKCQSCDLVDRLWIVPFGRKRRSIYPSSL